ncbi:MAG: hypothetical protein CMF38_02730 [Legionellaceae bacterium]|nr:hypothetical protein [Legionellaceae bacterium]HCA89754.1 hypothetical protein [Legionellales bacterium]|tara:strand:- start:83 stop:523 length:441 start_codon:yes stop_codon:yes gene_type:complete
MTHLYHLLYQSKACVPFDSKALTLLAKHARFQNFITQVSGLLIYSDHHFFQILEGSLTDIEAVYDRILADSRHTNIQLLDKKPIDERAFWRWNMGLTIIDKDSDVHAQLLDYLHNSDLAKHNQDDATFILNAFANQAFHPFIQECS